MIHLEGVGKRFSGNWIFRNVSLTVKAGESVVILGPSGGGKSVLLKIIAKLLEFEAGSIRVDSSNVGMLFQRNALFDSLSIEENLLFPLKERLGIKGSVAQERSSKLLRAVGLQGTEKLFPDEISGGMQKRLGIARALVVEPDVLLYDEPTAGLDPITSCTIAELIQNLRRERGTTLLSVTNDIQRAYQLADRIFLLAQGKLVEGGSPKEVQTTALPELKQFVLGLQEGPLTNSIETTVLELSGGAQ